MKRILIYGAVGVAVSAAVLLFAKPARTRFNELRSNMATIAADTGDMSGASYQRFQARREAVARMQEDLRTVARAESAYMADSGRPTVNLPAEYWRGPSAGNVGPYLRIERDGFRAMMMHTRTTMRCVVFARFDTLTNTYHPGDPDCRTESGEAWDAILAAEAVNRPPEPARPDPPPPPQPPAALEPRPHRDWGSVNNTPPPMPYVVKGACEGEGCTTRGLWAACSTVVARSAKRPDAPQVFTVAPGERFTALTIDIHVETPGMVVFRHNAVTPSGLEGGEIDSIVFTPADTLYLLNESGEGYLTWWFRGQAAPGYQFWRDVDEDRIARYPQDTVVRVREARTVHWVHARNTAGREGWIEFNYYKMATGGYMDEVERCLHPSKG